MDIDDDRVIIDDFSQESNPYIQFSGQQAHLADIFFNTSAAPVRRVKSKNDENSFNTDFLIPKYRLQPPLSARNISNAPNFVSGSQIPSDTQTFSLNGLKPVSAIPEKFRCIFSQFPFFNLIQSKVFDDVLFTDKSIVVSAPTGSGKTVIFELAIIRLLMKNEQVKTVYMGPVKALCSEKCREWKEKFAYLGLTCCELTSDTEGNEYTIIKNSDIILTTPEKWDKLTRCWSTNEGLFQLVKLFLIDEVHLLNCETRGPTLEAVVSRMKMLQTTGSKKMADKMRFMAVSATIPNADDIGKWLSYDDVLAISVKVGDEMRPVKLKKVVLSYPCSENWTQFRFDMSLNYKISNVIQKHSEGKPTLVFCSTRNGVIETARVIGKENEASMRVEHKQKWFITSNTIKDAKLKEFIKCGVGFHHAGLDLSDRQQMEALFGNGELPILVATSTLAMGVNLPAHLVVIKSTFKYQGGTMCEYTESEILQMIGRAGRPQFDVSATAVIMTKYNLKLKYENLIGGTQLIESYLHKHLIEHLNAEIVLRTISNVGVLLIWIRSTFLYVRVLKHPKLYGIQGGLAKDALESKLLDICVRDINTLVQNEIILMGEDGFDLNPTQSGRLMARYCLAFETMKLFIKSTSDASINDLVNLVASCSEFSDITLRTSEKKILNTLNKDKQQASIRFPMEGKIKTREMKINCLIQASLGNICVQDSGLNQDVLKIMRLSQRISKCLADFVFASRNDYKLVLNAVLLSKCLRAQLWENSYSVAKQLDKIGVVLATHLVRAGLTSFKKIANTNPRELEMILNRHPPFGNQILKSVGNLPNYQIEIEEAKPKLNSTQITITLKLTNIQYIAENSTFSPINCFLLIGNAENQIVFKQKITNNALMQSGQWTRKIDVEKCKKGNLLHIHVINEQLVGVDINMTFHPTNNELDDHLLAQFDFSTITPTKSSKNQINQTNPILVDLTESPDQTRRQCNHLCANKSTCLHLCCKEGVKIKTKRKFGSDESSAKQTRLDLVEEFQKNSTNFANNQNKRLSEKFIPSIGIDEPKIQNQYDEPVFSLKFDYSNAFSSDENTPPEIQVHQEQNVEMSGNQTTSTINEE
uniref:DNA 3'-5' helicase n=1 Tax=Strigamia maritima TaxID=126957 RepID=T1IQ78_STRMM